MAKSIITIETEKKGGTFKRILKVNDKIIYDSTFTTLFEYTDKNLLENIRRALLEIDTEDNFKDVDYGEFKY
jgi:hypothetical protein